MAALTVPVVTLSTMESARWLCNFWLQSECCKGRGKEFSGGITTAERAESLEERWWVRKGNFWWWQQCQFHLGNW